MKVSNRVQVWGRLIAACLAALLLFVLMAAFAPARAIDASTQKELWNSDQKPDGSDRLGNVAKFTLVTIANGKVYVPTFSNKLVVYGLKP
jgi:hypothetical protein